MSDRSSPTYWWVNQGSTFDEASKTGFIWAPQKNKAGRPVHHWNNVAKVRGGDIIFHYADGKLRAVSQAKSDAYEAKKELGGSQWTDHGWRVDGDYCILVRPIPMQRIGSKLAALQMVKGPVNKQGGANQGYLFKLSESAVRLLQEEIGDDPALEASGIRQPTGKRGDNDLELKYPADTLTDLSRTSSSDDLSFSELSEMFYGDLEISAIYTEREFIRRLLAAVLSKRFLILTGLAGTGKTKLAQALARWITPSSGWANALNHSQGERPNPAYTVVPVGADWTGSDNILGYPDGLDPTRYVTRPALDLIQRAAQPENADIPHFLILDEMNLSHVERYFADLLSLIESGESTELYHPALAENGHPQLRAGADPQLRLSPNLFIIGTVNVDETTYMFSPKVLDRANVIEFRMDRDDLAAFLASPRAPDLDALNGRGSGFGAAFAAESAKAGLTVPAAASGRFRAEMLLFFDLLRDHNAEFGFRVVNEAARFMHFYRLLGGCPEDSADWFDAAMDAVIVQKLLPKLHGSRPRLEGLLWALAYACGGSRAGLDDAAFLALCQEAGKAQEETRFGPAAVKKALGDAPARYPLSFDKVLRMWDKLLQDQFVTFAEA